MIQKTGAAGNDATTVKQNSMSSFRQLPLFRSFTTPSSSNSTSSSQSSYNFVSWYSKKLETHPYTTKGITSGLISLTGDVTCQYLTTTGGENDDNKFDYGRSFRFFIMGTFWVAPITNYWYTALSTRIIPGSTRTFTRVAKRLCVDQFLFAPIFVNSFMSVLWLLEGKSMNEILKTLKEVATDMIVANWSLWIPAMAINFSVVPLRYQVLFSNIVALIWNVYLSWMSVVDSRKQQETSSSSLLEGDGTSN